MNTLDHFVIKKRRIETQADSDLDSTVHATTLVVSNDSDQDSLKVDLDQRDFEEIKNLNDGDGNEAFEFPTYWKKDEWLKKLKENEWLILKNGKLGCRVCIKVGTLGPHKTQGVRLSKEWIECSVTCFGNNDEKKRQSIRKKMFDHKNSAAHKTSIVILDTAQAEALQKATAKQEFSYHKNTCHVFRTVYTIVKLNRPFSDLPTLLDMQSMNGIEVGRILQSDHSCGDIAQHISECMKSKLIKSIINSNLKIGIMIDESTTVSKKSALIICLKTVLENASEASSFFFDLVELSDTTATTILDSMLASLYKHGFTHEYFLLNLISFATDGASNMLGRKNGVAALLIKMFPDVIIWHCSNHRLELAVNDVVQEINEVDHMKHFFDKLYSLYSASPKNQTELAECASSLSLRMNSIGRILGTRWVASSARSIRAVWNDYPALVKHFEIASNDKNRDSKEKATYNGLKIYLTDTAFVSNMALMYDALTELEDLSLELQKRSTTLIRAHKLLEQKCRVFDSMSVTPGEHFEMVSKNLDIFKGITLHKGKVKPIKSGQFFRSLCNNMKSRMLKTQASHLSTNSCSTESEKKYVDLIKDLEILDEKKWPENPDICFGDKSIKNLCKTFNIQEKALQCVSGFRQNLISEEKTQGDLKPLLDVINTLIISTAECERSFSNMNDVLTLTRNSLRIETVSNLIFLKNNGPPLKNFQPESYVKMWIGKGRRHADFTACRSRQTEKVKTNKKENPGLEKLWSYL